MTPYRRGLVRLPLQRSLFGRLGDAALLLGLSDRLPEGRFGAWLSPSGDLFLDRSHVARLVEALPARLTSGHMDAAETAQRECCTGLVAATERAAERADGAGLAELRSLIGELGERIAALLPYGVLSKFVPDALHRHLVAAGDARLPPFPQPSFGAELAGRCLALYRDCLALGWPPERLEAEWPAVEPEVAALVRTFCLDQAGSGPLQWEAPGYENPRFVFRIQRAAFANGTPRLGLGADLAIDAERSGASTPGSDASSSVRRYLAFWLDFLERETWYVRRAFYQGMVPLLRRLAALSGGGRVEELLLLELAELRTGTVTPDLSARRREYLSDTAYLARLGIGCGRLRRCSRRRDEYKAMTDVSTKPGWSGVGGAPGRAAGPACVLRGGARPATASGSILVTRVLHPHLAPLLFRSAGVVVEEAALLQHATSLAREFGIPAVLGLRDATELFRDGDWLEIDGASGRVTRRDPAR